MWSIGLSTGKRLEDLLEAHRLDQGQSWGNILYVVEECSQVLVLQIVALFSVKPP